MTQSSFTNKRPFRPTSSLKAKPLELELSFFVVIILSGVYIAYELMAEPRGGHPFGHWLGIIGTLLMVMTEILYSLRKRTRLLNWGWAGALLALFPYFYRDCRAVYGFDAHWLGISRAGRGYVCADGDCRRERLCRPLSVHRPTPIINRRGRLAQPD